MFKLISYSKEYFLCSCCPIGSSQNSLCNGLCHLSVAFPCTTNVFRQHPVPRDEFLKCISHRVTRFANSEERNEIKASWKIKGFDLIKLWYEDL